MKKLLGIREDVSKIPTEKHIETSRCFSRCFSTRPTKYIY